MTLVTALQQTASLGVKAEELTIPSDGKRAIADQTMPATIELSLEPNGIVRVARKVIAIPLRSPADHQVHIHMGGTAALVHRDVLKLTRGQATQI